MSVVTIPAMQLLSLNQLLRLPRGQRIARIAVQRNLTGWMLLSQAGVNRPALPLAITIVRVGPKPLDAHDNLPGSAKHIVDAVAKYLGVDDADTRVRWEYRQERGASGVRVEFVTGGQHA